MLVYQCGGYATKHKHDSSNYYVDRGITSKKDGMRTMATAEGSISLRLLLFIVIMNLQLFLVMSKE